MSTLSGRSKDVLIAHAMHIFQNLEFRPMSAVSLEDQFIIKETLLMIYRDAAPTAAEHLVRQKALEFFRKAHGKEG